MIFKIIFRNLLYKPLGTVLSILLLMFGVGIISMLLTLYKQAEDKFDNDLKDIDLVIGAKGSPLQLVLSAVYHIDAPTGNILRSDAEKIIHNPLIKQAIPLAYGDSYKTYPIIGTDSAFLKLYGGVLQQGNLFTKTLEAVVGSNVAASTALKENDTFFGTHGMGAKGHVHKEFQYKVVGILKPTNTVLDNLVLTNVATVWAIHNHHHHDEGKEDKDDDDEKKAGSGDTVKPENELTAFLIKFRSPMGLMMIPRIINETTNMQAASPVLEINRLFDLLGVGIKTMQAVAFAIMLISGLSVFISLYGRLQERKYELALARSMGSSRLRLFAMVLAEGITLSLAGFLAGILLSRFGLLLLDKFAAGKFHIDLRKQGLSKEEGWLFLVTLGIGLAAALIPAVKAFRLNISKTLAND
ncbi:MAG TPA: FtsX-like permease family protein [Puia sp.]|uniref:ABC transporter permease n=1 Tax=Puia sp. TaxID=2045100 RepID=UPI002C730BE5|nr:FtsX-like permease family protein [Puia sp.]HVU94700.1 FtsX-like permease family protein [Puia sp.]